MCNSKDSPFTEEEHYRMVNHMNEDHADSVLLYVRYFGKRPEAEAAVLKSVNASGMNIEVQFSAGIERIRIPFEHALQSTHDAHMTLVAMSKKARRGMEGL